MIHGIGTDLVSVRRIEQALARHGERFMQRILGEAELAECVRSTQPARFLAKRFAAKEAFSKAWGTGIGAECGWHDIAIGHDARGKPLISPSQSMAGRFAEENIVAAHVSLSDEDEHAMAFVILEKEKR